jgi:hypothetical protein
LLLRWEGRVLIKISIDIAAVGKKVVDFYKGQKVVSPLVKAIHL